MTTQEAMAILQPLMEGRDPDTGDFLPFGHTCLHPQVRQALSMALSAMEKADAHTEIAMTRKNGKLKAGRSWTEEDCSALVELYQAGTPIQKMCSLLQRRERGIKRQLAYLGCIEIESNSKKPLRPGLERAGKPWTQAEDMLLRELYQNTVPIDQIAAQMQRSKYAIFCRMENLSLYGSEYGYPDEESLPKWTNENNRTLRELFGNGKSISELAEYFHRPEKNISARLFYMGLIQDSPLPRLRKKE